MSTATIRPEVAEAIAEIRFETGFPLNLQIVSTSGATRVVPTGAGYGIEVDESATEDDIYDLSPTLERIADTVECVWAL